MAGTVAGMTAPHDHRVESSQTVYAGRVITVRRDVVTMPGDTTSAREVVEHPGAVGVVALDDQDRVLLVTQYRHPVRRRLQELPAGLLDHPGEPALEAAQRELAEEAGLAAARWDVLVDTLTSSGMTDEAIRVFLARDLRVVDRQVQEHEELDLTCDWVPLDDAVRRVQAGELENGMAAVGLLSAELARRDGWTGLRPADAPWRSQKRA